MQLGFVSAIVPDLTLEEVFATAAQIGYDCVEVMCWPQGKSMRRYAGITHIDCYDFDVTAIKDLSAKYGVAISALGYYPNPLSADQSEARTAAEHIMKVLEVASEIGVDRFNTFIGRNWTQSIDDNWPVFIRTWVPLIAHAEEHGIRVGIENCPMLFTADEWPGGKNLAISPAIWARMFESIPSPFFGLNYDPSHLVFQQMNYLAPLRDFIDRIFHVHAKDVRVDQHLLDQVGILAHPLEYHSPKLPGMGDVDWGQFFSVLTDLGYQGPVCVEVEDRAYEHSLAARKLALQQSHTYLRNFVPHASAASLDEDSDTL